MKRILTILMLVLITVIIAAIYAQEAKKAQETPPPPPETMQQIVDSGKPLTEYTGKQITIRVAATGSTQSMCTVKINNKRFMVLVEQHAPLPVKNQRNGRIKWRDCTKSNEKHMAHYNAGTRVTITGTIDKVSTPTLCPHCNKPTHITLSIINIKRAE